MESFFDMIIARSSFSQSVSKWGFCNHISHVWTGQDAGSENNKMSKPSKKRKRIKDV